MRCPIIIGDNLPCVHTELAPQRQFSLVEAELSETVVGNLSHLPPCTAGLHPHPHPYAQRNLNQWLGVDDGKPLIPIRRGSLEGLA